jgi:hypothetical protein
MNWYARCAYDAAQKRRFHSTARARLRKLATELGLPVGSYDLRSNQGGIAVSGEVTLHHEAVYIQVSQPATGCDTGIFIRTCRGRRDSAARTPSFRSPCWTTSRDWRRACGWFWLRTGVQFGRPERES